MLSATALGGCAFAPHERPQAPPAVNRALRSDKKSLARARHIGVHENHKPPPRPVPEDPFFEDLKQLGEGYAMSETKDSALRLYMQKFSSPLPVLTTNQAEMFTVAIMWTQKMIAWDRLTAPCRVLTHDETMSVFDMKASAGWPAVCTPKNLKSDYFSAGVQMWLASRFPLPPECNVTYAGYKVEALPIEKVQRKGCRILRFFGAEFLYSQVRATKEAQDALYSPATAWPATPILGGFSEMHGGWNRMHSHFEGYDCYGADGKYYDTAFPEAVLEAIRMLYKAACDPSVSSLLDHLFDKMAVSQFVDNHGDEWEVTESNCTGHYGTKVFNDLCSVLCLTYAWIRACHKANTTFDFKFFSQVVRLCVSGDDVLVGVRSERLSGINYTPESIMQHIGTLGVSFAFERGEPSRSYELEFLSTSSRRDDVTGMWLPVHKSGKSVTALMHARHTDRTPEARFQRAYGVYMAMWPDATVRQALRKKAEKAQRNLPAMSPYRLERLDDVRMRSLYLGLESGA